MEPNEGLPPSPDVPAPEPAPTPFAAPPPFAEASAPPVAPAAYAPPPWRPVLPPIGEFLRGVLALGRKSIRPALPALVVLCFYRFGMGLYLVFSGDTNSPLGFPDYQARALTLVVTMAAYLPLLVLVYTPFLPLQDALLRGTKRSFVDSVKHVLELLWPYGISSLLQFCLIAIPAAGIVVAAALPAAMFGAFSEKARAFLVLLALFPAFLWIVAAAFLVTFATPLLILDGRGPVASIRESVSLVKRHAGGLLGRLFVFVVVLIVAGIFASFPSAMLSVVTAVARQKLIAVEIARAAWDSLVNTAMFPFTVAGLLLLYRAVVPAADAPPAGAAAETPSAPTPSPIPAPSTTTTTNPYLFE